MAIIHRFINCNYACVKSACKRNKKENKVCERESACMRIHRVLRDTWGTRLGDMRLSYFHCSVTRFRLYFLYFVMFQIIFDILAFNKTYLSLIDRVLTRVNHCSESLRGHVPLSISCLALLVDTILTGS